MRDVFICHAGSDKAGFARPLVRELGRRGLSCWIDEAQIAPGDSLLDAINLGIGSAHYVAVLVTERFLARPWTNTELNASFSREIRSGETVVIPVLAVEELLWVNRYPLLADKLYLSWSLGPEEVAERIASRFERRPAHDWHCDHPPAYIGHVWIRVLASQAGRGGKHRLTARWGPYIRHVDLGRLDDDPISLVHHKMRPDDVTLQVEVEPPAIVTFGQGPPPDSTSVNIDEGWTRTAGWNFPSTGPTTWMASGGLGSWRPREGCELVAALLASCCFL